MVDPKSKLIIRRPENIDKTSELELLELRLQQDTKVKELSYISYPDKGGKTNVISLSLQPNNSPVPLQLSLGAQPLQVVIEGYQLPELGLQDSPDQPEPIEFTFQPDIQVYDLELKQLATLSINLPGSSSDDSETQLLGKSIEVKDMQFYTGEKPGASPRDFFNASTIIQGQIRMAEQDLKIEKNQFLNIEKPGVQRLIYLNISEPQSNQDLEFKIDGQTLKVSEPPKGLEVRLSGRTTGIQVGLDPEIPVASIRANFLANYLSKDVIVGLISFSSAMITAIIIWLFENYSETPKEKDNSEPKS
ncbi:hypothetical protein [Fischerella sp. PCC 9605]|uniref:hypothetical protein n=1 Tax=Fischerella sp. PCC 9605 TaxID=1173024 RepID=UPI0004BCCCA7|nr:hypothetical protein [Fischerella sp. PCC 9605]